MLRLKEWIRISAAARTLGLNNRRIFLRVTLPLASKGAGGDGAGIRARAG